MVKVEEGDGTREGKRKSRRLGVDGWAFQVRSKLLCCQPATFAAKQAGTSKQTNLPAPSSPPIQTHSPVC